MSEPRVMSAASRCRRTGAQGSLPEKACEAYRWGCFCASSFFYRRNQNNKHPNRYAPASRRHIPYDLHSLQGFRPSGFLDCACGFARNDNHFCHLERSVSGVERSRVRRTCTGANHNGSRHFTVETPRLRSG